MEVDNQIIYDLLKEVREEQKNLGKEMAEHKAVFQDHIEQDAKMYDELKKINEILAENTQIVKEHERRSLAIELVVLGDGTENNKGLVGRLDKLEEPEKAKEYLYKKYMKIFKFIGAAGAAFGVISKYLGWW